MGRSTNTEHGTPGERRRRTGPRGAVLIAIAALLATVALAGPASAAGRPGPPAPTAWSSAVDVQHDLVYGSATTAAGATVPLALDVYGVTTSPGSAGRPWCGSTAAAS